jgi:hypothetical protein
VKNNFDLCIVHDPKYHDLRARGQWTKKIFFCLFHTFRWSITYLCYIPFENAKNVENRLTLLYIHCCAVVVGVLGSFYYLAVAMVIRICKQWRLRFKKDPFIAVHNPFQGLSKVIYPIFPEFMMSYASNSFWRNTAY